MPGTFSAEELSAESGVSSDRLDWLVRIGIIKPPSPGRFRPGDSIRARMIAALLDAGFAEGQIEQAVSEGNLVLDHVDHYLLVDAPHQSGRTFAEFSDEMGPRGRDLPAVYKVLGLPEPDPSEPIDLLEEALLEQFLEGWRLATDEDALMRAARMIGEGTRLSALGWMDLFLEQVAGPARDRFLRGEVPTYPPEVSRSSTLLVRLIPRLMAWLTQRYIEQLIFAGIVDGFEAFLEARGRVPASEPSSPPAVVFADLSGYTRVTDEQGDEMAVRISSSLQSRAEAVAADKGGRLVKLLGDGAMLYFREPLKAAEAAVELVRNVSADLGLPVRAGVHAGPVIERDRDLFGRTVNLASRLAGAAGPGEVIVSEAIVRSAPDEGLQFEPVGDASLKGFAEPVPLFRIRPQSST